MDFRRLVFLLHTHSLPKESQKGPRKSGKVEDETGEKAEWNPHGESEERETAHPGVLPSVPEENEEQKGDRKGEPARKGVFGINAGDGRIETPVDLPELHGKTPK